MVYIHTAWPVHQELYDVYTHQIRPNVTIRPVRPAKIQRDVLHSDPWSFDPKYSYISSIPRRSVAARYLPPLPPFQPQQAIQSNATRTPFFPPNPLSAFPPHDNHATHTLPIPPVTARPRERSPLQSSDSAYGNTGPPTRIEIPNPNAAAAAAAADAHAPIPTTLPTTSAPH